MRHYYLIRCGSMERADRVYVRDFEELVRMLSRYVARYGVLDSLIEDGRT